MFMGMKGIRVSLPWVLEDSLPLMLRGNRIPGMYVYKQPKSIYKGYFYFEKSSKLLNKCQAFKKYL